MALYMMFYVIPDAHIDYLQRRPAHLGFYLQGEMPAVRRGFWDKWLSRAEAPLLPAGWPSTAAVGYSPEINHRMVQDFHFLLNDTEALVSDAGCVFQTWFRPRHPSCAVTIDGENFALKSAHALQLRDKLAALAGTTLHDRYRLRMAGDLSADDCHFLDEAFGELKKACDAAVKSGYGLMWTSG